MFGILRRLQQIDGRYYIVFNKRNNKWEVHMSGLKDSYCLTCPYATLDSRLIDYVYTTSLVHNPNLIRDIELNNASIDNDREAKRSEYIDSNLKDVYDNLNSSTKRYDWGQAMNTKWL